MAKSNFKLGQEVFFDQDQFNYTWKKYGSLLAQTADLKTEYEKLGVGEFTTQKLHELLASNGCLELMKAYKAVLKEKYQDDSGMFYNLIDASVKKASATFSKMIDLLIYTAKGNALYNGPDRNDLEIKDGKPFVDEAKIRERFTVSITNEAQIGFLEMMGQVQKAWNEINHFVVEVLGDKNSPLIGSPDAIFSTDEDGKLLINERAILIAENAVCMH